MGLCSVGKPQSSAVLPSQPPTQVVGTLTVRPRLHGFPVRATACGCGEMATYPLF